VRHEHNLAGGIADGHPKPVLTVLPVGSDSEMPRQVMAFPTKGTDESVVGGKGRRAEP